MKPSIWTAAALVVLTGCGGGSATGPTPDDPSGAWSYSQLTQASDATCSESGRLDLRASGAALAGSFEGRGGCESPGRAVDFVVEGALAEGRVEGAELRFSLASCRYSGQLSGDTAAGTVICAPDRVGGADQTGTWGMRREGRL